jgi:hypothetical protein
MSACQTRFNRGTRLPDPAHALHRAGHQAVTVLNIERAPTSVTAGRRRPRAVAALSSRVGTVGAPPPFFLSLRAHLTPLFYAPSRPPLLTIAGHRHPFPSPSEPGIRSAVTSSSSSTSFKPEPMAIASSLSASSLAASSSVSSSSPAAVRAPPAPPPL